MCGGEQLSDMRYAEGALSYLSHAQEVLWPDPGEAEIQAEAKNAGVEKIAPELISLMIELSGKHLGVIRELLGLIAEGTWNKQALTAAVSDSPTIWAAVTPLKQKAESVKALLGYCEREDLGVAQRYIENPTLRKLFWLNLITRRPSEKGVRLAWRSTLIRDAVREILTGSA